MSLNFKRGSVIGVAVRVVLWLAAAEGARLIETTGRKKRNRGGCFEPGTYRSLR